MLYRRLRDTYRKLWVIPKLHRTYGKLTAANAFSRIYESSLWSPTDGARHPKHCGSRMPSFSSKTDNYVSLRRELDPRQYSSRHGCSSPAQLMHLPH